MTVMSWFIRALFAIMVVGVSFPTGSIAAATNPLAEWRAATSIGTTSAILNGELIIRGDAPQVWGYFEYGTTNTYGTTTPPIYMTAPGNYSYPLTDLNPDTLYHYRVCVGASEGWLGSFSPDKTFKTLPSGVTHPSVATLDASNLGGTTATLNGSLISKGDATSVNVSFEWGFTSGYVFTTTSQMLSAPGVFNQAISSLNPNQTYHFRSKGDGGAFGIVFGDDRTFRPGNSPVIATVGAEPWTFSARLNGTLTALGAASTVNTSFEYGLTAAYGTTTPPQAMTATGPFTAVIAALVANTTYYFRAKGDGGAAGVSYGTGQSFKTDTFDFNLVSIPGTSRFGAGTEDIIISSINAFDLSGGGNSRLCQSVVEECPSGGQVNICPGVVQPDPTGSAFFFVDFNAGTLAPGTYSPKVSVNWGADKEMVTIPIEIVALTQPLVRTVGAQTAGGDACLYGRLVQNPSINAIPCSFDWGPTTAYGNTTLPVNVTLGDFSSKVTGLAAKQTYHVRALANAGAFGTAQGDDVTFQTGSLVLEVNQGVAVGVSPGGSRVNVPVWAAYNGTASSPDSIRGFDFTLKWDPAAVRIRNLQWAPAVQGWTLDAVWNPDNLVLRGTGGSAFSRANVATFDIEAVGSVGSTTLLGLEARTFDMLFGPGEVPVCKGATVTVTDRQARSEITPQLDAGGKAVCSLYVPYLLEAQGGTVTDGLVYTFDSTIICDPSVFNDIRLYSAYPSTGWHAVMEIHPGLWRVRAVPNSPQPPVNLGVCIIPTVLDGQAGAPVTIQVQDTLYWSNSEGANSTHKPLQAGPTSLRKLPSANTASLTFRRGDAKADGAINIFDAMYIAQCIVGLRPWSAINAVNAATVKHDGAGGDKVDIFDAMYIAQYVVNIRNNRFESLS